MDCAALGGKGGDFIIFVTLNNPLSSTWRVFIFNLPSSFQIRCGIRI